MDHTTLPHAIQRCTIFMHDRTPCHNCGIVKNGREGGNINVLEWSGNSTDLNPIVNAWNVFHNRLKQQKVTSLPGMIESIRRERIAKGKPWRLRQAITVRRNMTKC